MPPTATRPAERTTYRGAPAIPARCKQTARRQAEGIYEDADRPEYCLGVGVLFLLTRDGLLLEEAEEQGQWSAMWMSCGMTSL